MMRQSSHPQPIYLLSPSVSQGASRTGQSWAGACVLLGSEQGVSEIISDKFALVRGFDPKRGELNPGRKLVSGTCRQRSTPM